MGMAWHARVIKKLCAPELVKGAQIPSDHVKINDSS